MRTENILIVLCLFFFVSGCEDFVKDTEPLIDSVEDSQLDDPSALDFMIKGLHNTFAMTYNYLGPQVDVLSDQLIFDEAITGATYPSFRQIENGSFPTYDNNTLTGSFRQLGELRKSSTILIDRIDAMDWSSFSSIDSASAIEGYYVANLYEGLSRYFYASYWGISEQEGGGVISETDQEGNVVGGPFVPSSEMYDDAIDYFNLALDQTDDDLKTKTVNSLIARCYLYKENYAMAAVHVELGLLEGDPPFQALFLDESPAQNQYYTLFGDFRTQAGVNPKFYDWLEQDPLEVTRIPMLPAETLNCEDGTDNDNDSLMDMDDPDCAEGGLGWEPVYNYQYKYQEYSSPISVMTWQENYLMMAECALQGESVSMDAPITVNAVRASHGLSPISGDITIEILLIEREKELFCQGSRLMDQRRYNQWHLGEDKWKFLPITAEERNTNPNL